MQLILRPTAALVDQTAAHFVSGLLLRKPSAVLGLPTGSTPMGLYACLRALYEQGVISFSHVTTFNLDEYLGLDGSHPSSYRRFMQENLFDHVDILPKNTHVPIAVGEDISALCAAYDDAIAQSGGIDLMVLGMGGNGHIGFNEPGTPLESRTHVTALDEKTIRDNRVNFTDPAQMPHQAITMGLASIMECRSILLLIKGADKAEMVKNALTGAITPRVPASLLRMHPDVTVILDAQAASRLPETRTDRK